MTESAEHTIRCTPRVRSALLAAYDFAEQRGRGEADIEDLIAGLAAVTPDVVMAYGLLPAGLVRPLPDLVSLSPAVAPTRRLRACLELAEAIRQRLGAPTVDGRFVFLAALQLDPARSRRVLDWSHEQVDVAITRLGEDVRLRPQLDPMADAELVGWGMVGDPTALRPRGVIARLLARRVRRRLRPRPC